jgi:putative transposase
MLSHKGVSAEDKKDAGERHDLEPDTEGPRRAWATQQARNLLMDLNNRAAAFTFLIRDRAGPITRSFDAVLTGAGAGAVEVPPRCPRAN